MAKSMLLVCCLAALAISSYADSRILAGQKASKGQFPHQVSVQIDGKHKCGGSILAPTKILTAADCIYDQSEGSISVVAGITSLQESVNKYQALAFVVHDRWNNKSKVNDIAVITLENPISYNENIQPIKLANRKLVAGEKVTLSGWGVTKVGGAIPDDLQWADLKFLDLNTCAIEMIGQKPITYGHICTKTTWYQGMCNGDSGNALVDSNGLQVGVASWEVPCGMNKPDIYSSIQYFYEWINKQL